MLVPFGRGLDGRQRGAFGIAGNSTVNRVRPGLLVERHRARVVRPQAAQDASGALLGESRRAGSQPDLVAGCLRDEAQLLAVQCPEILAVLDAVEETAGGQLREEARRVNVRQSIDKRVVGVRVDAGIDLEAVGAMCLRAVREGFET